MVLSKPRLASSGAALARFALELLLADVWFCALEPTEVLLRVVRIMDSNADDKLTASLKRERERA